MSTNSNNIQNELQIVIGVDGGGSKTACAVLEVSSKTLLGTSQTGSANQNSVGQQKADENLMKSILLALNNANKSIKQVVAVCLCLAGINTNKHVQEATSRIQIQLQNQGLNQMSPVIVYNDAAAALSCGTMGKLEGVVLIGGTGTIAFGRRGDKEAYASGWGPAFLDPGSGYDLGQRGLAAAAQHFDGRGPETKLTQAILDFFEIQTNDFGSVIDYVYKDTSWAPIARLAPLVVKCATENDDIARQIIKKGVDGLLGSILAVVKKLDWDTVESQVSIVLAGGLLEDDTIYPKQLQVNIQNILPKSHVMFPKVSCAEGAALLAIQQYTKFTNGFLEN
eukprot:TRINITY_DN17236_c0_g1_i1.p1 TRINITY_DN17236_c0_g1~~TRINITY_DN17236_c0_g1_i1.p1  ORF type:complete len:337 (-),score=49.09 TRINITY_DN17236_c0_g1_i1:88-1098(-)